MVIWIDGDSCPKDIKEVVYKAAIRTKTKLNYIANSYHKIPQNELFHFVLVDRSFDAADTHILENIQQKDIVITSDIPFAYEAVIKKAYVLNSRGEHYTEENIRDRLATRDLMEELRSGGMVSGGPRPLNTQDKTKFANALDKILQQHAHF